MYHFRVTTSPSFTLFPFSFSLQAKGQFKKRSTANNVDIVIPVPADADSPKFRVCRRGEEGEGGRSREMKEG